MHLEGSVESDDADMVLRHRVIAKWLKHFLTFVKEELVSASKAKPPTDEEGENDYMELSSAIDLEDQ